MAWRNSKTRLNCNRVKVEKMKSKRTDLEIRYILLFKLDAKSLFDRIVERQHDYI